MLKEFKAFAMKGNLVDMAVAFVMGAAFSKVVTAFTSGIVSPIIALIIGGPDLSSAKTILRAASVSDSGEEIAEVALLWGSFVTSIIDFIIVAFVMFMIIRGIAKAKKKEEEAPAAPPAPSKEEVLLGEIRDLLKK